MTIAEIIQSTIGRAPVQFLHECLLGARSVKAKRDGTPAYTRVEFATQNMSPNDAMYWAGGRANTRKPQYVGLVVWVPLEAYEQATSSGAVDPHVYDTGKPDTRDDL